MKGAVHTLPLGPGATLGKTRKKKAHALQSQAASLLAAPRSKKTGFTDILRSKIETLSTDRLPKAAETAIGLLKEANPPAAAALEKAFRTITDDSTLTPRQKLTRLKTALDQVMDAGAAAAARPPDPGVHVKKALAMPEKREAEAAAPVAADTGKKTDKTRVFVWDLRKSTPEKGAGQTPAAEAPKASKETGQLPLAQAVPDKAEHRGNAPEAPAAPAPATPAERIQEMTGSDLAKTAGIILKDGGGEIRLLLKPESLGSVRVRLNLTDNRVDGMFIVDNPSAKQAIEGNLDTIMQALSAEGFQTASLSVSVGGGNSGAGDRRTDVPAARRVESIAGFSGSSPDAVELPGWDELLVNLFA